VALVTFYFWMPIAMGCIWFSVYIVTGQKTQEWIAIFAIALLIMVVESVRWWVFMFTESHVILFWMRVAATLPSMIFIYVFAEFRLSLDSFRQKLWIATLYPGVKLILYLLIHGYPKQA
jgi:hypothetical protein